MWVHLILGLTAAVFLAIIALTGAYITFQDPLHRWLNPVPAIAPFDGPAPFATIVDSVAARFPTAVATVDVRNDEATVVRLRDRTTVFVDPRSGSILGSRPGRLASLENFTTLMRRLHTNLVLGPRGRLIVTLVTAEALLLALTGLWLWWRNKHWRFGTWRGSMFRVSWDLHNATGIWFIAPVLSMVLTGLLLAVPQPVYRVAGAGAPWLLQSPRSTPLAESAAIGIERVLQVADSVRPADPAVSLSIPGPPTGSFAVRKSRETVYVDQFSAQVLEVRPHRVPTAGDHAIEAVENLHTGAMFGMPGR
ncbi:MAG TPA: PepSY-associated TM helix domain-containing protein, partial [Gemmatimonadaceae bacterium]